MIQKCFDVYRRLAFPVLGKLGNLREHVVVYTIGARDGLPSSRLQYLHRQNAITSVGFEPDPEEAARLGKAGVLTHVLPFAVGRVSGAATLYLTRMRGASSLYPPDIDLLRQLTPIAEEFQVEKKLQVELRRLDELIDSEGIPPPELLHIDAQASELDILQGAGRYLQGVSVITLEVQTYPVYRGQKLFHEIAEWLWKEGFVCCQIDNPNDSPVFSPFFVEANVSFVHRSKLESGCERTRLLMELARLGEHSTSPWKTRVHKLLKACGFK